MRRRLAAWWRARDPAVYVEPRDQWVGRYIGDGGHVYVCLVPCVVLRYRRAAR